MSRSRKARRKLERGFAFGWSRDFLARRRNHISRNHVLCEQVPVRGNFSRQRQRSCCLSVFVATSWHDFFITVPANRDAPSQENDMRSHFPSLATVAALVVVTVVPFGCSNGKSLPANQSGAAASGGA